MESLYSVLALSLTANCPSGFERAWIEARLAEDFSSQRHVCEVQGKLIYPDIPVMITSEVDDALHALRDQMTIPGQEPWSRCTFTLFPDGKFKFDVEYDD